MTLSPLLLTHSLFIFSPLRFLNFLTYIFYSSFFLLSFYHFLTFLFFPTLFFYFSFLFLIFLSYFFFCLPYFFSLFKLFFYLFFPPLSLLISVYEQAFGHQNPFRSTHLISGLPTSFPVFSCFIQLCFLCEFVITTIIFITAEINV